MKERNCFKGSRKIGNLKNILPEKYQLMISKVVFLFKQFTVATEQENL